MSVDLSSVQNHNEQVVFDAVRQQRGNYPSIAGDTALLADVACVALNRLPPRYIVHAADFSFYRTDDERLALDRAVAAAVRYAFEFVQKRVAIGARS